MDSLQLAELQSILNSSKGELSSAKQLFLDSIECTQLDILDPILERALDLREYFCPDLVANNISTPISSDQNLGASQSLPQVVLDATAVVHDGKYLGEGSSSVLPRTVVNFLEPNHSPLGSDVTSYCSDDSVDGVSGPMPEFSQLTSPGVDAPGPSFQWPSCSNVKMEQNMQHLPHQHQQHMHHIQQQQHPQQHFNFPVSSSHIDSRLFGTHATDSSFKSDEFNVPSAGHSVQPTSASDSAAASSFPFVTSPSASIPSPTSTVYSASSPGTPAPSGSNRGRRPHGCTTPYSSKSGKRRQVEKGTEEYVEKRARNNVAVRKSRAKAKQKQRETETRVKSLLEHNDQLQKKVDSLTKELNVLKGLFVNIGASIPDEFLKMMSDS